MIVISTSGDAGKFQQSRQFVFTPSFGNGSSDIDYNEIRHQNILDNCQFNFFCKSFFSHEILHLLSLAFASDFWSAVHFYFAPCMAAALFQFIVILFFGSFSGLSSISCSGFCFTVCRWGRRFFKLYMFCNAFFFLIVNNSTNTDKLNSKLWYNRK